MESVNSTIILVFLTMLSFGASRIISRFKDRISFVRSFMFCILGMAIGPYMGVKILDANKLENFSLLIYFLIGFLSFHVGLKVSVFKNDKSLFFRYSSYSFLSFALMFVLFSICAVFYIAWSENSEFFTVLFNSKIIGFLFIISNYCLFTSGVKHFYSDRDVIKDSPVYSSINKMGRVFQVIGIVLQIAFIIYFDSINKDGKNLSDPVWLSLFILSGPIIAFLFIMFVGKEQKDDILVLAILGCIFFASGLGQVLGRGVLVVTLLMGVFIAYFYKDRDRLERILDKLEEPASAMLIIFAASNMPIPDQKTIILAVLYIVVRTFIFLYFVRRLPGLFVKELRQGMGRGLVTQDSIPLCLALVSSGFIPDYSGTLIFIAMSGMIFNEWIGVYSSRSVMLDSDELVDTTLFLKRDR